MEQRYCSNRTSDIFHNITFRSSSAVQPSRALTSHATGRARSGCCVRPVRETKRGDVSDKRETSSPSQTCPSEKPACFRRRQWHRARTRCARVRSRNTSRNAARLLRRFPADERTRRLLPHGLSAMSCGLLGFLSSNKNTRKVKLVIRRKLIEPDDENLRAICLPFYR